MNDFDFDVLQKKRIARSAYHRKNGSKSKRCTLPSDYLTAAEKRKLNGEVKTLELDKPRTYVEYKEMSDSDRLMYLEFLKSKYHPSTRMLATMFGCNRNSVDAEVHRLGFDTGYGIGQKVSNTDKFNWRVFLGAEPDDEKTGGGRRYTGSRFRSDSQTSQLRDIRNAPRCDEYAIPYVRFWSASVPCIVRG